MALSTGPDKPGPEKPSGEKTGAEKTGAEKPAIDKPGIERLRGTSRGPVVAPPRALFNNRRRSRLLWLKVLLPIIAIGTIGYLSIWSYRNLSDTRITVEAVEKVPLLDAGMKVSGIAFEGRNDKDRAFSVTALSATETTGNKDIVNLEEPQAQIELSETSWIAVTAEKGVFDRQRDFVDLKGAVTLYYENGMTFVTDQAEIDLSNNDASSSLPVTGTDERRELTAEGFELRENGDVVFFKGRSHLRILPKQEGNDG
ncbi:LPS export ABC transporter periplasmic protein LptC [Dongia sp.]|uniref:LPS export ABC transporter periplasmic protein LptC n=1 Tax=Dongia sp. TaxID=1977262 RepID=UPI0035B3CB84